MRSLDFGSMVRVNEKVAIRTIDGDMKSMCFNFKLSSVMEIVGALV